MTHSLPLSLLLYFASLLLAIPLTASLAWYAQRQSKQPGSSAYVWIMATTSLMGVVELLSVLAPNQAWAHFWFQLRFLFLAPLPILWFLFALDYTENREWLSVRLVAGLFAVPLLTQLVLWSNGLHGLWVHQDAGFVQIGSFWIAQPGERVPGVWFLFYGIYSVLIDAIGIGLLLRHAWRFRRYIGQIGIVLATPLLPFLFGTLLMLSLPPQSSFNLLVPTIGVAGLLSALNIFRFDFLRRHPIGESRSPLAGFDQTERRLLPLLALIFVLIVSGVIVTGIVTDRSYAQETRIRVKQQLSAIASLKAEQLVEWRNSRLLDASIFSENEDFTQRVRLLVDNPQDEEARAQLLVWMRKLESIPQYRRIFLVDPAGVELLALSTDANTLPENHLAQITDALAANQPFFLDFHQHRPDGPIVLGVILPIIDLEQENRALGALVLEVNPAVYLYPFIQHWPVPSSSAETLLVRREGDEVVFLNSLRFQQDAALSLRQPLTQTDLPAVKAVLGQTGIVEGVDYRGVAVVADIRPIPDSPWFLVSKMDSAEAYAPLRTRLWESLLIYSLIILTIGLGLWQVWRLQQARAYREKLAAAEALAVSEELFRTAFLTNPDAVVITRLSDSKYVRINQGFTNALGYTEAEVVGKTAAELSIWENASDRAAYIEPLRATGIVRNLEARFRHKDGSVRIGLASASLINLDGTPHALIIARDITEHRQAERALHETVESRLRLIEYAAEHTIQELLVRVLDEVCPMVESPVGFYHFVEPDQRTLSLQAWSTATIRDYCKAEGEGLHYNLELAGVWADCVRQSQPIIHNDYASLPNRRGLPEGHAALVRELVVPIQRDGLIVAILGVGNKVGDYTEQDLERVTYFADVAWEIVQRKRAEEELARYTENLEERVEARTRELQAAHEQLIRQERLATLGQLAGSVGHELRNPLGVISNAIYLLRLSQPDANESVREYLSIIDSEVQTSNKIVRDLLDFTRIKSLDRRPADVADLVRQSLERFPPPASVQATIHIAPNWPLVYTDPQHAVQILGNLISNGCQAMDAGGQLTLSARREEAMVAIAVKDTGAGILPENMKNLFEPLFTTKTKGIGLGLSVSQKLAEANQGYITVTSEPGSGSTFTLHLPVHKEIE